MCALDSPDTSLIVLDIGLGFQVELTLEEAVRFIADKEEHMERSAPQASYPATRYLPSLCIPQLTSSPLSPLSVLSGWRRR